jgi:hypothetical protein
MVAFSQKWNVAGEIFYGTFKMKSMKDYQQSVVDGSDRFKYKIVDNFPAYVGYNFIAGYNVSPRTTLGVRVQYTSTGGRLAYGDYSGERTIDHLLHGYSLGLNSTYRLANRRNWEFYLSGTAGVMRTSLTNVYSSYVYDQPSSPYEYRFRSYNYFFNPAIAVKRRFNDHLGLCASLGYEFQIHRTLRSTINDEWYLKTTDGKDDVVAEWDGLRISIGISYRFGLSRTN